MSALYNLHNPLNANGTRNSGTTAGLVSWHVLSAGVNYTRCITDHGARSTRPDQSLSLAVCGYSRHGGPSARLPLGSPYRAGAPGQRRLAHARAFDVGAQTARHPAPSGFALIAEDATYCSVACAERSVHARGQDHRLMINVPARRDRSADLRPAVEPVGNSIARDAGMLAYISINAHTAFDRRVQHGVDGGGGQSGYVQLRDRRPTLTVWIHSRA